MTRHFEFTDAASKKFWEITVSGESVTVRYGRIGAAGQSQTKAHATPVDAKTAADKQIAEKLKKGYRDVSASGPAATQPAVRRTSATRSAGKRTPARKVATKSAAIDRRQLAAIRKLFVQDDPDAVLQGIALVRAIDEPALWTLMAEGTSVDDSGCVQTTKESEVRKRVTPRYRPLVGLWALWGARRLGGTIKKCGNERQTVAPSRVTQSPPGESRHRKGATARDQDRHSHRPVKSGVAVPRSVYS